jgi:hypothetical protein
MTHDNLAGAEPASTDTQFGKLRAALAGEAATPEIVAIFQQIKNLRESDRSLRSIRRNLDLDNMPTLDPVDESIAEETTTVPTSELGLLLDSFISLKREKDALSDRLARMIATADQLETKVNKLTDVLERNASKLEPGA